MSGDRIDDADATNTTTPWFPSKAAYATLHDWLTYTEARYRVLPVIHVSQALQKEAMDVMLDMCLLGDARHGNGWVGSETDSKNEIRWQSQPATSSVATSLALCRPKGCVTCSPVRDNGDPQVNMYKIASRSDTAIIGPPNVVSGVYVEAIGDHERAHAAAHCKDLRFAAFSMDNRMGIYGVNPGGSLDGNSTTMGTMARLNSVVTTQSPEEKEARKQAIRDEAVAVYKVFEAWRDKRADQLLKRRVQRADDKGVLGDEKTKHQFPTYDARSGQRKKRGRKNTEPPAARRVVRVRSAKQWRGGSSTPGASGDESNNTTNKNTTTTNNKRSRKAVDNPTESSTPGASGDESNNTTNKNTTSSSKKRSRKAVDRPMDAHTLLLIRVKRKCTEMKGKAKLSLTKALQATRDAGLSADPTGAEINLGTVFSRIKEYTERKCSKELSWGKIGSGDDPGRVDVGDDTGEDVANVLEALAAISTDAHTLLLIRVKRKCTEMKANVTLDEAPRDAGLSADPTGAVVNVATARSRIKEYTKRKCRKKLSWGQIGSDDDSGRDDVGDDSEEVAKVLEALRNKRERETATSE